MRRSPFELYDIGIPLAQQSAKRWVDRNFHIFVREDDIGVSSVRRGDGHLIKKAFLTGARQEIERLSRSTGVDFRGLSVKTIERAAKNWFEVVYRQSFDVCSLVAWRNVLTNSHALGAEYVTHHLFPNRSAQQKKAVRRKP